ncbi:hypothetical protein ME9_00872 [Bartonella taylorii 8TBB]|uniref:Uncharacterized protein n=1 Tax=Bartonella taylorii 8TBB TaxID=1094560 RepID=A0A9P2RZP2_BARTA|nr:hypothetical protein ME9_00872 [Bartonella taylorii 8TBB]OPB34965.1 hypothetical protein Btaycd_009860 [Bartonella taylorii]
MVGMQFGILSAKIVDSLNTIGEYFIPFFIFIWKTGILYYIINEDYGFRIPKVILEAVFCVFIKPSV